MQVLTDLQKDFLRKFAALALSQSFFLTGGTALSAFYLHHRFSEDLDFFTAEEGKVSLVLSGLEKILIDLQAQLEIKRNFRNYLEIFINRGNESLRCDFAMDSPYRLQPLVFNSEYNIYIDDLVDIACNKLSALFDRNEPKDFVDIFFLHQEQIPLETIVSEAKKKHVGMDDYWLAVSFSKAEEIEVLPRMIKAVSIDELKKFFEEKSHWLMPKLK